MEKLSSPDQANSVGSRELNSVLSVVAALVGAGVLIVLAGYLTMQLQLSRIDAVMGFGSRAVGVSGDWLPYVWVLSLVLLACAAAVFYRVVLRGTPARLTALVALAAVAFLVAPVASGSDVAAEQQSLILGILFEGAKSPLVLALVGVGAIDLFAQRKRTQSP
jgi:uncharacterized BrkB/YihY/UPF0761 family membrane protein